MNDFIKYYGENKISPVNQDISDFDLHLRRRQKLYRQCGVPTFAFKNANMLEVGPGGGHNALCPLFWGVDHIDLVEPNKTGADAIPPLFEKYGIQESKYRVYNISLEDFDTEERYDIIVAEGFIQHITNWKEVANKLFSLLNKGGGLVLTCSDDGSLFIELMKRLIARIITRDCKTLDEKVDVLIPVFQPQLDKLVGVSRPAKDWIQDQCFNPSLNNGVTVSIRDMLEEFNSYDLLGSSPSMFNDYTWYKDVSADADFIEQYNEKRLSLILSGMSEIRLCPSECETVFNVFTLINKLENEYERTLDISCVKQIIGVLKENKNMMHFNREFAEVYDEIIPALESAVTMGTCSLDDYPHFFSAFGRGAQYISFMKP